MKADTSEEPRLTPEAEALLDAADFGYLGVIAGSEPYVLPLSFAREGQTLYLHTGRGKKVEAFTAHPHVCFTVVELPQLIKGEGACNVGFAYRSLLIRGVVRPVEEEAEKKRALKRFVAKYHAEKEAQTLPAQTVARTLVFAIQPEVVTLKTKLAEQPAG